MARTAEQYAALLRQYRKVRGLARLALRRADASPTGSNFLWSRYDFIHSRELHLAQEIQAERRQRTRSNPTRNKRTGRFMKRGRK